MIIPFERQMENNIEVEFIFLSNQAHQEEKQHRIS